MKLLLKPKKPCCKSKPRCKRCPVVAKRLIEQGVAERRADGLVVVSPKLKKKQLQRARQR